MAHELAAEPHLLFACGRYEGIDQRVLDHAATRMPVTEVSLGDYVLFGGEVAVLVILEAVTRLLPGVLGNAGSLDEESHAARAAGGAGLHQAGDLARARGAGGAALRRPRPDRPLAARRGAAPHGRPPARPARRAARRRASTSGTGRRWTGAGFQSPPGDVAK